MSGSSSNNGSDDEKKRREKNVIEFPQGKERKSAEKQLRDSRKSEGKDDAHKRGEREKLEDEYRKQYKAEQAARARLRGKLAQNAAGGKQPFINWEKIPPFARFMVAILLIIQVFMSFFVSAADKVYIVMHYGFVPAVYTSGEGRIADAVIAPFTSLLLHGDWMHIVFNVVMLLAMGIFFERTYGTKRAVIFFLLCGMAGHLAYLVLNPFSTMPVIGASGAISGLFAVTVITMSESGMMGPEAQKRGPLPFILLWISIIVIMGALGPGTAWQSHLGGFVGGIGFFHLWKRGILKF
ncbi:MAG: rhomboid family intramembrane serine protease [Alphaproteobacteria bacterium]